MSADNGALPKPTPPLSAHGGGLRVLLVEDDDLVRAALLRGLTIYGYAVWAASSGPEALRLCAEIGHIDLLITDLLMPEINGVDLARTLLACGCAQRVLFVSGYTDDVVLQGETLPVTPHCLQKPFTPTELVQKIQRILAGAPR